MRVAVVAVVPLTLITRATSAQNAIELTRAAHRAGHAAEAEKLGERAVAQFPDSASAHLWLARAYILDIESAAFYRQIGLSKRARASMDRAVQLDPNYFEARETRARYYMNAPSIGGGSADKAKTEAEIARRIDPYRGALLCGQFAERQKQVAAAEQEYSILVRAYPDSAPPFNRLVNLYQNSRQYPEAFRLIESRAARMTSDESALYQAGKTAALSGQQLERGEAALRSFLALGTFVIGSEANARYRLGMILEKRGELKSALHEYDAAAQLDSTLADARAASKRLQSR